MVYQTDIEKRVKGKSDMWKIQRIQKLRYDVMKSDNESRMVAHTIKNKETKGKAFAYIKSTE